MTDTVNTDKMNIPVWIAQREMNKQGLFGVGEMSYEDAVATSIASLKAYGESYPHWVITYSGGKDSSALVSFVLWAIEQGKVQSPENLTILYADTRMEFPPLYQTALKVLDQVRGRNYTAKIVRSRLSRSYWVQILGRGLPPPKRHQRWCTRSLKAEPMDLALSLFRKQFGEDSVLVLTGVRMGESAARDNRIIMSCSKNDGECGQGWFQQSRNALAPLLHWRVCWIWKWLYSIHNPLPMTTNIEAVYKADDFTDIRTGCFECNLVDKDWALHYLVQTEAWGHLAPLQELRGLYTEMYEPQHRHRRIDPYVKKDGTISSKMTGALGPLTIPARQYFFEKVRDIERRAGVTLIDPKEERLIRFCWKSKIYPHAWTGDEPIGNESWPKALVVDGKLLGHQTSFFGETK